MNDRSMLGSRVFDANVSGPCRNGDCSGIKEGDRIFYAKGETTPQHVPGECRIVDPLAVRAPLCPTHFIEVSVTGVCPECE